MNDWTETSDTEASADDARPFTDLARRLRREHACSSINISSTIALRRAHIGAMTLQLLDLLWPGLYCDAVSDVPESEDGVRHRLERVCDEMSRCAHAAFSIDATALEPKAPSHAERRARAAIMSFLDTLPRVRRTLSSDIDTAYQGDPAATGVHEIILAYPGVMAIAVYRLAHELYREGVPLLARLIAEWAHAQTGIDIHPGAAIGEDFFIDHGTGVVIGETAVIGRHVKIYQGVTLGALSIPKDERGWARRGVRRHPTIEDNVTIYANATVLGGATVVGRGSVIGASAFITESVPPNSKVAGRRRDTVDRGGGAQRDETASQYREQTHKETRLERANRD